MASKHDRLRLAVYAAPPAALDTFHSFDPESFVVASMIADALVMIDVHGELVPNLATRWERDTPVSAVFELREGVTFHDGTPMDADDVLATFEEHIDPHNPTINGRGIFSPIERVEKLGPHRIRIRTRFPDALLFHRLFFSQIYPAHVLKKYGRAAILRHPIGTGAFELVEWNEHRRILLQRNRAHWSGGAQAEQIELPIVPQTEWVDAIARGEIDLALGIDAHDAARAREAGLDVQHGSSTISHFFLLANRGPLADRRVRQALNYAVHRDLLVQVGEHGAAQPATSLLAANQYGYDPALPHYPYSVDRAVQLLAEAGYPDGFTIRGLVSNTSSAVFLATREFLARVGVRLEAEVVPRPEWMQRVVIDRMRGAASFEGDFAVSSIDNPTCHGLFHHFIFLFSHGPFSLTHSPDYDQRFLTAATTLEPDAGLAALHDLGRYVHDEALALFTINPHVYTAARPGVTIPLPASGHFNASTFWSVAKDPDLAPSSGYPQLPTGDDDLEKLLDATEHPSIFFGADRSSYDDVAMRRLWDRLLAAQSRRSAQDGPMLRELVSSAESKLHLANVLDTTTRVGIVGYNDTGRQLFVNAGYREMVEPSGGELEALQVAGRDVTSWDDIRASVDACGTWSGAVALHGDGWKRNASLHLTATQSTDRHGATSGYTYVFSDFSGAEERVRSQALHRIMDHVPYGLFTVTPELTLSAGYSRACAALLGTDATDLQGASIIDVLGLEGRAAEDLACLLEQVFTDVLPADVSLAQLPSRIALGTRILSLTTSVIRDVAGEIEGVLFSALDVTALEAAQREIEATRAAIGVLEDRDRFERVALSYLEQLEQLAQDVDSPDGQARIRRELHTFKGEFGMFGQREVVAHLHRTEDAGRIRAADLHDLREAFEARLRDNDHIWRIRRGPPATHSVDPEALERLVALSRDAGDLHTLRTAVLRFATEAAGIRAAAMVGPLAESCRRLATRLGKSATLTFEGGDVRVPEAHTAVYRVLPHLLRNALDHGIEPPEQRGGKPPTAVLTLRIARTPAGFELRFSDDGRGIAVDALTDRAVRTGRLTQLEAAAMDDAARLQLIFEPGLSTATETTEVSGRGIGMSAVREVVEAVGGTVSIDSESGVGTTLTMCLPGPSMGHDLETTNAA